MDSWITGLIESMGYFGLALLMALENIFPPIPSELVMPLAGYASSQGQLNVWLAIVIASLSAVVGTLPWYWLARKLDKEKVHRWIDRHGHWLTMTKPELERAERWFSGHGRWALSLGRLVPGLRTLISVPAGFCKVPLGRYLAYSFLGTLVWTGALAHLGKALGENYSQVSTYIGPITYVVLGGILLTYVVRLVKMRRRNHLRRESHA